MSWSETKVFANLFREIRSPDRRAALGQGGPRTDLARQLVEKANEQRDQRHYASAALLYEEALSAEPAMAAIHIQCGHMFKEAGKLAEAERHYLEAQRLSPDDADLALQFGHFYKVAGRPDESEAAYRRAAELSPGWSEPRRELARIRRANAPPSQGAARTSPGLASLFGRISLPGWRVTPGPRSRTELARQLVGKADEQRDRRHYASAARLYEEALRAEPAMAPIHIQCGHMFKEAGKLAEAERHYLEAQRLSPDDADLALQLGHFYKRAGRPDESEAEYKRAVELSPGWSEPLRELAQIRHATEPPSLDAAWTPAGSANLDLLAPELAPTPSGDLSKSFIDSVHVLRLGARRERSRWGFISTLRGVEALRGYCISSSPVDELQILLDGRVIDRGAVQAVPFEQASDTQRKYVYNAWVDFSPFTHGPHRITLRFMGSRGEVRHHSEHVVVAPPRTEADYPDSDGVVELSEGDARSVEAQIRNRPSVVRSARRALLPQEPRNVLVLRTDQLGDLVISVPALRRLREMFPQARLVGLLTPANADLARASQLFDEVIVIEFPEDKAERRRVMSLEAQEALRQRLAPYRFDIAIDLCGISVSRPLLLLSGARFLYGFNDRDSPWLNAGFEGVTHDPHNGHEMAAQSTKVLALVERLGTSLASRAEVIRRPDLTRDMLAPFGITANDRYVVLHGGAGLAFSRWPHFEQLAALVLERTDLKIVLFTDDPKWRATLPAGLLSSDRFQLIDERLPFDSFDALLSFCTVFVGNDSGPKHLAALRGSPVVSIHSARINWNEWGQELTGSIISRRTPCAGCGISGSGDECGKQFACIVDISVEEVFGAMADVARTISTELKFRLSL